MKRTLTLMMALVMVLSIFSVAQAEDVTISLWSFPVLSADGSYEAELIAAFEAANPGIKVELQTIDYTAGDDKLNAAIETGKGPDLLIESPQRINKYGSMGKLVALDDLFTDELKADILNQGIIGDLGNNGHIWTYPQSITAHCMVINKDIWTETGAIKFVNLEGDRTWTTENFVEACKVLAEAGYTPPAIIYCGGQGGDQGTRALISNLYSASFTDDELTKWTFDSEEAIKGLSLMKEMIDAGTLGFDAGIAAAEEIQLFANGTIPTSLCWNAVVARNNQELMAFTDEALPFPSDDGVPVLEGGLFGFGLFDNGDEARIEAAKKFIQFVCHDEVWGPKSVAQTGFFPIYASVGDVYAGSTDDQLVAFGNFTKYLGKLFNTIPSFTEQRPAWFGMLQEIGTGTKTAEQAAIDYVTFSNEAQAQYNK